MKIFIIDDDESMLQIQSALLAEAGHEIQSSTQSGSALEKIRASKPDCVITDIMMPDQDGIETVLRIKEFNANIKVIVISGGGHQRAMDFLPAAERLGADLTLKKPFKPLDVLEAVGNLLQTANVSA